MKKLTGLLMVILIVQIATLGLEITRDIRSYQAKTSRKESARKLQYLSNSMIEITKNYQDSAYHNPNVDRISEQQLMAMETLMDELGIISMQLKTMADMQDDKQQL